MNFANSLVKKRSALSFRPGFFYRWLKLYIWRNWYVPVRKWMRSFQRTLTAVFYPALSPFTLDHWLIDRSAYVHEKVNKVKKYHKVLRSVNRRRGWDWLEMNRQLWGDKFGWSRYGQIRKRQWVSRWNRKLLSLYGDWLGLDYGMNVLSLLNLPLLPDRFYSRYKGISLFNGKNHQQSQNSQWDSLLGPEWQKVKKRRSLRSLRRKYGNLAYRWEYRNLHKYFYNVYSGWDRISFGWGKLNDWQEANRLLFGIWVADPTAPYFNPSGYDILPDDRLRKLVDLRDIFKSWFKGKFNWSLLRKFLIHNRVKKRETLVSSAITSGDFIPTEAFEIPWNIFIALNMEDLMLGKPGLKDFKSGRVSALRSTLYKKPVSLLRKKIVPIKREHQQIINKGYRTKLFNRLSKGGKNLWNKDLLSLYIRKNPRFRKYLMVEPKSKLTRSRKFRVVIAQQKLRTKISKAFAKKMSSRVPDSERYQRRVHGLRHLRRSNRVIWGLSNRSRVFTDKSWLNRVKAEQFKTRLWSKMYQSHLDELRDRFSWVRGNLFKKRKSKKHKPVARSWLNRFRLLSGKKSLMRAQREILRDRKRGERRVSRIMAPYVRKLRTRQRLDVLHQLFKYFDVVRPTPHRVRDKRVMDKQRSLKFSQLQRKLFIRENIRRLRRDFILAKKSGNVFKRDEALAKLVRLKEYIWLHYPNERKMQRKIFKLLNFAFRMHSPRVIWVWDDKLKQWVGHELGHLKHVYGHVRSRRSRWPKGFFYRFILLLMLVLRNFLVDV